MKGLEHYFIILARGLGLGLGFAMRSEGIYIIKDFKRCSFSATGRVGVSANSTIILSSCIWCFLLSDLLCTLFGNRTKWGLGRC